MRSALLGGVGPTVYDRAFFVAQAMRKGANDYWVKASFDFGQLKDRLEKLIPGQ